MALLYPTWLAKLQYRWGGPRPPWDLTRGITEAQSFHYPQPPPLLASSHFILSRVVWRMFFELSRSTSNVLSFYHLLYLLPKAVLLINRINLHRIWGYIVSVENKCLGLLGQYGCLGSVCK